MSFLIGADNCASTSDFVQLVLTGSEATEAESEEKETLLILLIRFHRASAPLSIPLFYLHWIVRLLALLIPTPLIF